MARSEEELQAEWWEIVKEGERDRREFRELKISILTYGERALDRAKRVRALRIEAAEAGIILGQGQFDGIA